MASETVYTQLRLHLRPLGWRMRLREGQHLAVRTLWLPLAIAALVLLAGRVVPLAGYRWLAWGPLAIWALAVIGYSLLRPAGTMRVARATDGALGLRDRLATALELSQDLGSRQAAAGSRVAGFDPDLVARQQADALTAARALQPRRAFPLHWPWRPLALAAGLGLAAVLLAVLPNPQDAVLAERAEVRQAAQEQAADLEALAATLADDETLPAAGREELLRELREAIEALRANPGDLEQALADTARLEAALRSRLDPQSGAQQAALEGLGADLSALAGTANASQELEDLAELLQELAAEVDAMSSEERDRLANALGQAAAGLAGSDPSLAGALSALAQEIRSGETSAESVRSAARGLDEAARQAALQGALAQALNSARSSSDALAQSGRGAQGPGGQGQSGQSGQPGQGQGGSQGQGQGQGQAQGQGTTGGGGGTTAPSGPPSTRPGRAGAPTAPNKAYEVTELDTVFAPWQRGEPGDADFLPGRQTGQGEETMREEEGVPQAGMPGAATVPYSEVYASYAAAAAELLEREYIPAGLKDYVQDYFSKLEP